MIEVVKRNGDREPFSIGKLAGTVWRGIEPTEGDYQEAIDIARAVFIHLRRKEISVISSGALLDLVLRAMRRMNMAEGAVLIELHSVLRSERRKGFQVVHENGKVSEWDKTWLARLAGRMWFISTRTARHIAGEVEMELLERVDRTVKRQEVVDLLNEEVSQFGLADAVPVRQFGMED
jgi:transcriptional regulator NrdR family protein